MDYTTLIHTIVDPFLSNKDSLLIREIKSNKDSLLIREIKNDELGNDITILIVAQNTDIARLIGKKGCVANAIRDIVSIAGKLDNKRIHLKFESFDEDKKGE